MIPTEFPQIECENRDCVENEASVKASDSVVAATHFSSL